MNHQLSETIHRLIIPNGNRLSPTLLALMYIPSTTALEEHLPSIEQSLQRGNL